MTPATTTPKRPRARTAYPRMLRAELTKFTTIRFNWVWALFAIAASAGIAALNTPGEANNWRTLAAADRMNFDPIKSALFSIIVAALTLGSVGSRSISTEYSTGMIRVSLAAMHHRGQVVMSKATLIALYAFLVGVVANIAALAVGTSVFHAKGVDVPIGERASIIAIVLGAASVGVLAVIGVALGTLLRRPAAADIACAVFLFGGQTLTPVLPDTLHKFIPMNALVATISTRPTNDTLVPALGLAVLIGYACVALLAATQTIVRRDA